MYGIRIVGSCILHNTQSGDFAVGRGFHGLRLNRGSAEPVMDVELLLDR